MGITMRRAAVGPALLLVAAAAAAQAPSAAPYDSVAAILGTPAVAVAGGTRYNFPRTDLQVRIGGTLVSPAIALGGWAGFAASGSDTLVMGDLVVTAEELPGVLRQCVADRVEVTGVHNHLVGEEPRVMYVHYMARGGALDLAARIARIVGRTAAPRPVRATPPAPLSIDTALVFGGLGLRGRAFGAVALLGASFVSGPVAVAGAAMPAFAYSSPLNLQAVSPSRYVATGDFAVPAGRTDGVIRALTGAGILVTAVHSHMVGETPAVYFIHFWAEGTPTAVVQGLRSAVDAAR